MVGGWTRTNTGSDSDELDGSLFSNKRRTTGVLQHQVLKARGGMKAGSSVPGVKPQITKCAASACCYLSRFENCEVAGDWCWWYLSLESRRTNTGAA